MINMAGRRILQGVLAASGLGMGLITWDIYRRRKSESHTIYSMFNQYLITKVLKTLGGYMEKKLTKDTLDCAATQEEMLLQRLEKNKDTEYGIANHFSEIKSREDFVRVHPLTRYDHYEKYVKKIADGQDNVLTSSKVYILGVTSGTSGQSKLLPTVKDLFMLFFTNGVATVYSKMTQAFPGTQELQRTMKLFYMPKWRESAGGVPIGPNSSTPKNSKSALNLYSTPPPAYEIPTEPEALYVHLLFGLKDRNLGMIEANFASLVFTAFQFLSKNWEQLVKDIETGCIDPSLKIDESVRGKLNKILKPDVARAKELKMEFTKGNDGIVRRIWPYCNLVLSCDTGTNEIYGDLLKAHECEGVPFYSPLYAASEGLLGVNLDPLARKREYLLVPRAMFFEFIPIDHTDDDSPQTLFVDQVRVGEDYELVITNLSGLYRYRFGDVVRVAGFYNTGPKIEFLYRQGQLLNVRGEKTSEKLFYECLMTASSEWASGKVKDYCCVESALLPESDGLKNNGSASYYILFVETDNGKDLTEEEKNKVDSKLCEKPSVYDSFRQKGSIGPIRVMTVKPGTFSRFKQYTVDTTEASANQFKVPRVLKRQDAVKFMMGQLMS